MSSTLEELRQKAETCSGCSGDDRATGCEICELRYRLNRLERNLENLYMACKQRKVFDEWPAIYFLFQAALPEGAME